MQDWRKTSLKDLFSDIFLYKMGHAIIFFRLKLVFWCVWLWLCLNNKKEYTGLMEVISWTNKIWL